MSSQESIHSKDELVQAYSSLPIKVVEDINAYIQRKIDLMMRNREKSVSIHKMHLTSYLEAQFSSNGRFLMQFSYDAAYDYALKTIQERGYKIISYPNPDSLLLSFFLPRGFQIFNPTLEKKA